MVLTACRIYRCMCEARKLRVVRLLASLAVAGLLLAGPRPARAQVGGLGTGFFAGSVRGGPNDAVGVGLWYSVSRLSIDAATSASSNEVHGLTDALPGTMTVAGPSLGISFKSWGLNVGFNEGQADVHAKADVNQTPNDSTDDVYVISARRSSRTLSLVVNPLRWLFLGYSVEDGTMEFSEVSAGGSGSTRKLPFHDSFYSFGLAGGFDPRTNRFGLVFSLYAKIPTKRSDFTGSEYGLGVGFYL